jgi:hypothetical protein
MSSYIPRTADFQPAGRNQFNGQRAKPSEVSSPAQHTNPVQGVKFRVGGEQPLQMTMKFEIYVLEFDRLKVSLF